MPGIFINYRRADTQAWALGLFDKFAAKLRKSKETVIERHGCKDVKFGPRVFFLADPAPVQ